MTFVLHNIAYWFILTSNLQVKITGQSFRSHDEKCSFSRLSMHVMTYRILVVRLVIVLNGRCDLELSCFLPKHKMTKQRHLVVVTINKE